MTLKLRSNVGHQQIREKMKLRMMINSTIIVGTEFHNILAQGAFHSKSWVTVCFSQFGGVEHHSSIV